MKLVDFVGQMLLLSAFWSLVICMLAFLLFIAWSAPIPFPMKIIVSVICGAAIGGMIGMIISISWQLYQEYRRR